MSYQPPGSEDFSDGDLVDEQSEVEAGDEVFSDTEEEPMEETEEERSDKLHASVLETFVKNNEKIVDKSKANSIVKGVKQAFAIELTEFSQSEGIVDDDVFYKKIVEKTLSGALKISQEMFLSVELFNKEILKVKNELSRLRSESGEMTDERFEKIERQLKKAENFARYAKADAQMADRMLKIASAFRDPTQSSPDPRFEKIADFAKKTNEASKEAAKIVKQILPGRFAKGVGSAAYYLAAGLGFLGTTIAVVVATPFVLAAQTYNKLDGGLKGVLGAVGTFVMVAALLAGLSYITFGMGTLLFGAGTVESLEGWNNIFKRIENFCNKKIQEPIAKALVPKDNEKSSAGMKKKALKEPGSAKSGAAKEKNFDQSQSLATAFQKLDSSSSELRDAPSSVQPAKQDSLTSLLSEPDKSAVRQVAGESFDAEVQKGKALAHGVSDKLSSSKSMSPPSSPEILPMLRATQVANKDSISTDRMILPEEFKKFQESIKSNPLFKEVLKNCQVLNNNGHLSLSGVAESVCSVASEWVKTQQAQQQQQAQDKPTIGFKISGNNFEKVKKLFEKASASNLHITTVTIGKDTCTAEQFHARLAAKKEQASPTPTTQPEVQPSKQTPAKQKHS